MADRTTTETRARRQPPNPSDGPTPPWWKRHTKALWVSVGAPVIVAVSTALVLDLLGLGDQTEPPPSASDTAAGKAPKAPLAVTAADGDESGCVALPGRLTLEDRTELVSGGDVPGVFRRAGGARTGDLNVSLTLEGGARSLTITSIDIESRTPRASPPYDGTLVCEQPQGEEKKVQMFADMDEPRPVLRPGRDADTPYFRDRYLTLAPQEQMSLSLTFSAEEGSREFGLTIRYVQGGKRGKLTVPSPEGTRYAVTGFADRYGAVYRGSPAGFRLEKGKKP